MLVVLLIVLLLFGSTKLPKLAKSLGQASKEFKKSVGGDDTSEPTAAEQITMTRADLDAALAERDARAGKATPGEGASPA